MAGTAAWGWGTGPHREDSPGLREQALMQSGSSQDMTASPSPFLPHFRAEATGWEGLAKAFISDLNCPFSSPSTPLGPSPPSFLRSHKSKASALERGGEACPSSRFLGQNGFPLPPAPQNCHEVPQSQPSLSASPLLTLQADIILLHREAHPEAGAGWAL